MCSSGSSVLRFQESNVDFSLRGSGLSLKVKGNGPKLVRSQNSGSGVGMSSVLIIKYLPPQFLLSLAISTSCLQVAERVPIRLLKYDTNLSLSCYLCPLLAHRNPQVRSRVFHTLHLLAEFELGEFITLLEPCTGLICSIPSSFPYLSHVPT